INGDVYIYNYPANSGNNIEAQTILKLLHSNENLVGIKDTVADFSHTKEILETVLPEYPDFKVYSGFDNQFVKNNQYGGSGNISALSNMFPDVWSDWVKSANDNNNEKF